MNNEQHNIVPNNIAQNNEQPEELQELFAEELPEQTDFASPASTYGSLGTFGSASTFGSCAATASSGSTASSAG